MSSSTTETDLPPQARGAPWPIRWLRAALKLTLTVWSVLLLAWLTLHWGLLPRINDWRSDIEAVVSQAVGATVSIGQIEMRSPSWIPVVELQQVRLRDAQGRVALDLPKVSAAISPRSLLTLELRLTQLHIDGAELVVRRDAQGRWRIGGIGLDQTGSIDSSAGLDWLLDQQEIVVERSRLLWIDELHQAAPLPLSAVRAVLRNGLRRHDMRIDATPPAHWGAAFSLRAEMRQPLLARTQDWHRWQGTVYAEWPEARLPALQAQLNLPLRLRSGEGAVRAWLDLAQGRWQKATVDVALQDLNLQLAQDLPALQLQQMSARLSAERRADGMRWQAQQLQFTADNGLVWPSSHFDLTWQGTPGQPQAELWPKAADIQGGEFNADRLDLAVVAELAERLPLPAALRRQLQELSPHGVVEGLQSRWTGSPEQPQKYRVKAAVRGLALAAKPSPQAGAIGRPGWRGADLSLDADEGGGHAQLKLRDGALILPGVFAEPEVPLHQFSSRLVWQITPVRGQADAAPAIEVRVIDGQFANADAQGQMQLRWHTGPGAGTEHGSGQRYPGQLELTGQLQQGRAQAVARYLPLSLGSTARDYVAAAVREGRIRHARFQVRGDLWDFPYGDGKPGDFQIKADVEGLTLAYVPATPGATHQWPPFSEVQGELVFDRTAMEIRNARAKLWGVALQGVNGRIAHLVHQPELRIEGAGRGPVTDALRFIATSPVGGWLSHALAQSSGTGQADLKLALNIPLDHVDKSTVVGRVGLDGNDLRLRPDVPALSQAHAQIDFTEHGFSIRNGRAQALGGELTLDAGIDASGALRLTARGVATAEGLRRAPELPQLAQITPALSGQGGYELQLGFTHGHSEFSLSSPLTGLGLDLPAPLHKLPTEAWPLRIQSRLVADSDARAPRDRLQLSLGSVLQADYERALSDTNEPKVLRGTLGLGMTAPPLPASGVTAGLKLGRVDLATWMAAAQRLQATPTASVGGSASASYMPTDWLLQAQALNLGGQVWGPLNATLQHRQGVDGERWRAELLSEQVAGQIEWLTPPGAGRPGRLRARLNHLQLTGSNAPTTASPSATDTSDALLTQLDNAPSAKPALDVVINTLSWQGKPLGRLSLETGAATADASEWPLTRLRLQHPHATLEASGAWRARPQARASLGVTLKVDDSGALLEQLGLGRVLKGGKGEIHGVLGWRGGPLDLRSATLEGDLRMDLGDGQVLKVEPGGAGRLLGILSLQSLPRRLTLDFRDVFQEGFSFDTIGADISLREGVARTQNFRLRGVQAAVLLEGQADLRKESQDLRLVVVPEINAGTASLAYAAINPALGLGTFLAQFLLREPLQRAGSRAFRIQGSWDQPLVEPMPVDVPAAASAPPTPDAGASTVR